jgi:hypothetical protein
MGDKSPSNLSTHPIDNKPRLREIEKLTCKEPKEIVDQGDPTV